MGEGAEVELVAAGVGSGPRSKGEEDAVAREQGLIGSMRRSEARKADVLMLSLGGTGGLRSEGQRTECSSRARRQLSRDVDSACCPSASS